MVLTQKPCNRWSYNPSTARSYEYVWRIASQGQSLEVFPHRRMSGPGSLHNTLRSSLVWFRNQGQYLELKVSFKVLKDRVLVQTPESGFGEPYLIRDSAGRELWQHSPPLPGSGSKSDTSSSTQNYPGKISSRRRSKKDQSFIDGDGI